MTIVLVALAASALLGLATGLVFRVWANLVVAPLVALGSALALASHGFRSLEGVLVTFACLFVSQLAYLIGVLLASPTSVANYLANEVPDNEPGQNREHSISCEQQEEGREHPSRSPPPEA
jgi:hypothetical protein